MVSRLLTVAVAALALGAGLSIATHAAVKTLNPVPVMVLTGYSDSQKFSGPAGLFVDRKRGDIWVADSGNHQIVEFDSQGLPQLKFRHMAVDAETGEATPGQPLSVAVDSSGQIFVADGSSDKIAMYDYRGRLIKRISIGKLLGDDHLRPRFLRVDGSDNLYVVDGEALRIAVLNRDQELLREIDLKRPVKTGPSDPNETAESVSSIDVGADGRIYVVNSSDFPCVRALDPSGKELLAFGDIDAGWDNFVRPTGVASIDDTTFWVADGSSNIVKQFSSDGKYQQYIGGGPGTRPGEMRGPSAVATDGKEMLCVAEQGTNRVQVFSLK
jgi:sugar lactone lactonase YvrE